MNDAHRFRSQAELCLRIAQLMSDPAAADQLRSKAADYLARAVELEAKPVGIPRNVTPTVGSGAVSFVALAFVRTAGSLVHGEEVECRLPRVAVRRAQAMSSDEANAGAIAFVRKSPRLVAFADAVVLKAFGQVPEDFDVG